jgi:hypothetical protein
MTGARVDSIDSLKLFRVALWKFAETANVALGDAEGEIQRTVMWLQGEQQQFWQTQIRKRHEIVTRCQDAVRQKKLFKDSTGRQQSAVDEEKALSIAKKRLEEAEQKLVNTKRHSAKLQRELHLYKGGVQRFQTAVSADIPTAVASLDRMVQSLESYVSLTAASSSGDAGAPSAPSASGAPAQDGASMARPQEPEKTPEEEKTAVDAPSPDASKESEKGV